MEKYSTARLEEELGLYGYLYNATQMCDRTSPMFDSPSAGWTNGQIFTLDLVVQTFFDVFCFVMNVVIFLDCPISLPSNVPVIKGDITCNLGTTCSDVVCCLYAQPLLRHVTIYLKMEFCRDRIILGIDRYTREIQPSTYKNWGKVLLYKLCMLCLINKVVYI